MEEELEYTQPSQQKRTLQPETDEEEDEEEEEISTSASYAAMSLSDTGSNWATINSLGNSSSTGSQKARQGSLRKLTGSTHGVDSTAVHIPLLAKNERNRYF